MQLIHKSDRIDYVHWHHTPWTLEVVDRNTDPFSFRHRPQNGAPHHSQRIDYRHWSGQFWSAELQEETWTHWPNNDPTKRHTDNFLDYVHWHGGHWRAKSDPNSNQFIHIPFQLPNVRVSWLDPGETEVVWEAANAKGKVYWAIFPLDGGPGEVDAYFTRVGLGSNQRLGIISGSGSADIPLGFSPRLKFSSRGLNVAYVSDVVEVLRTVPIPF